MKLAKKIRSNQFIKNNAIYFTGSIVIAFLNYLYYPILGRMMTLEDFGEIQAIISILAQANVFLVVFGYLTVNITSNHGEDPEKMAFLKEIETVAYLFSFVALLLLAVFSEYLARSFKFHSFYPFIALGILLISNVPLIFRTSILQGFHNFKAISLAGALNSALKLLVAIALVFLGFKTFGAVLGLIIANVAAIAYLSRLAKKNNAFPKTKAKKFDLKILAKPDIKNELKYSLLIFISLVAVTFLYTADVIFVKKYLSATEAGLYGGVATISRIIFFLTSSISGVLLASLKMGRHTENRDLLKKSLLLLTLIGGVCLAAFSLFPKLVLQIMIGQKYLSYANILPKASLFLFFASLTNMFCIYGIALRKWFVSNIVLMGLMFTVAINLLNHSSTESIVNNFLIGNIATLATLFVAYSLKESKEPNERI